MAGDLDGAASQPGIGGTESSVREPRPRWVIPAAVALVLVLIGALVASIWFGTRVVQSFVAEQGRNHAVAAAREVATNLTTFDTGTAEADTKRLLDGTTPSYASAFAGDQGQFLKNLHANQARSTGSVTEAGVLSYNPITDTAHVLVTVRAQVSNTSLPAGQARDYRIELTMVDQGRWLADQVEFIS